ncbi:MAG: hypothetical protein KGZ88_04470 [Methylomicrobium sp.]|nr:hypothetical protein [Methylomicrobium sp.]
MLKQLLIIFLLCKLTACTGLGLGLDNRWVQNAFDVEKAKIEQKAASGEISWVQAATNTRDLDMYFAGRTDLDTTWKYDQDDEEYHAYCIALAERLDRKQISYAEFDAARLQRFNAIQYREQALYTQQQIANTRTQQQSYSGGGFTCFKEREWTSGLNKNCVYSCLGSETVQTIGSTQLCPLTISK